MIYICFFFLKIFDGPDDSANLLSYSNMCSYINSTPITSTTEIVFIKLLSNAQKLQISWVSEIFTSDFEIITVTPNEPTKTEFTCNQKSCKWLIKSSSTIHYVFVHISHIEFLEEDHNCNTNLMIISGDKYNSICESNNNEQEYKGEPDVQIEFSSQKSTPFVKFKIEIILICGTRLRENFGKISFDSHDLPKQNNGTCSIILNPPDHSIQLKFTSIDWDCSLLHSRLYIKTKSDYFDNNAILNGTERMCGNDFLIRKIPYIEKSLALIEANIHHNEHVKFSLIYYSKGTHCNENIKISLRETFIILDSKEYFKESPRYKTRCKWIVGSESGQNLKIEFIDDIMLQNGQWLKIKNGISSNAREFEYFDTNTKPKSLIVPSSIIQITYYQINKWFVSNGQFKMNISIAPCGADYRDFSGTIKSMNYEYGEYNSNNECFYHINAPVDYEIVLKIDEIYLPYNNNCSYTDHLDIYNSLDSINLNKNDLMLIKSLCGNASQETIVVPGKKLIFLKYC